MIYVLCSRTHRRLPGVTWAAQRSLVAIRAGDHPRAPPLICLPGFRLMLLPTFTCTGASKASLPCLISQHSPLDENGTLPSEAGLLEEDSAWPMPGLGASIPSQQPSGPGDSAQATEFQGSNLGLLVGEDNLPSSLL